MTVADECGWIITRDDSFQLKNSANSAWHFIKFRSSLRQIIVNSMVDSHLKDNQLSCSKM